MTFSKTIDGEPVFFVWHECLCSNPRQSKDIYNISIACWHSPETSRKLHTKVMSCAVGNIYSFLRWQERCSKFLNVIFVKSWTFEVPRKSRAAPIFADLTLEIPCRISQNCPSNVYERPENSRFSDSPRFYYYHREPFSLVVYFILTHQSHANSKTGT